MFSTTSHQQKHRYGGCDCHEAVLLHFPLKIQLIGERAIDTGGVSRDMPNKFWEEVYLQHFEGFNLLVPSVTAPI